MIYVFLFENGIKQGVKANSLEDAVDAVKKRYPMVFSYSFRFEVIQIGDIIEVK